MTTAVKRAILRGWYNQAIAAGVPLCEYLQSKLSAIADGAGTGAGRRVQSASQGGESVSYGDPDDDVVSQPGWFDFLALSSEVCLVCTGTSDQEKLDCLLANVGYSAKTLQKTYTGLRGCGC